MSVSVSVRTGPLRWHGLSALIGWGLGKLLIGVLRPLVCRPRRTLAAFGAGWLLWEWTVPVLVVLCVAAVALELWAIVDPASFRARVGLRALAVWRRAVVYRRHWQPAMVVAELERDGELPTLGRVRCLDAIDVVQVRGLLGQRFGQWEDAGGMLAHVFGCSDVRVHRGDDRRLTLELRRAPRGRSWHRSGVLDLTDAR